MAIIDKMSLAAQAIDSIKKVLKTKMLSVAWSSGKDSSALLGLVVQAAQQLVQEGVAFQRILVTHGDTGVENPEVRAYADSEISRIEAYAKRRGIPLRVLVARPSMSESWALRVIGGRAIPAFPGGNHDCSTDMKVQPMNRLRKKVAGAAKGDLVTAIGTRFEESPARAARMRERGERPDEPWKGDDGAMYISPIAEWTADDVWEYLGYCKNGAPDFLTFSDFDGVWRIYADAAGTSCAVVGDMATKGRSKPCGARTGCWACTPIGRDKSLETMIETDERYAYLRGLNRLQRFFVNTRFDLSRRTWLGRTIDEMGYVRVAPDVYSPSMLKELLQYALTLDAVERKDAWSRGTRPRFQIISEKMLLAIDAQWNLYGYHKPFEALKVWRDIVELGARYEVPEVQESPRVAMPKPRWLFVGSDWADQDQLIGLRDLALELSGSESRGCMGVREISRGRIVADVNMREAFDLDDEGVELFFEFEYDDILRRLDAGEDFGPTGGYMYYARMGILSVSPQAIGRVDEALRRTWWKAHQGLFGEVSVERLRELSVSFRQPDLFGHPTSGGKAFGITEKLAA